jgi:lantibiotic leader peptide-processing serine protease
MCRLAPSLSLLACAALGACSPDPAELTAPRPARALAAAPPARHLVLMRAEGLAPDFAARVRSLGGAVEFAHAGAGYAVVAGLTVEGVAALRRSPDVQEVEPDETLAADVAGPAGADVAQTSVAAGGSVADPTLASQYHRQWNMHAIRADRAWAAGRLGSPTVRVAILDSGIDYLHPELAGLVDLARSASFVPYEDALVDATFPGRAAVTDLHGHGTHVASTVATNAQRIAGVTSRTTLMAVKVLDRTNTGATSGIHRGLLYAVDHGADVVNVSINGDFPRSVSRGRQRMRYRLFAYAYRRGALVVVGAGNGAVDMDHAGDLLVEYCDLPNVICVSATGPTTGGLFGPWPDPDAFAPYSNYGRSAIGVAAPGGNPAGGQVLGACSQTSLLPGFAPCALAPRLANFTGTSMATPHVSGLAALLVAEMGRGRPAQVRARILQSAADLGAPGTDPFYGKGRIDVARALGL